MPSPQSILILGSVWPEPKSSAAGTRMMQLIEFFQEQGVKVFFACSASNMEFSEDLAALNISTYSIKLNDSSFDSFLVKLNPTYVLFDRFMTEEQFGWRVAEHLPEAIRLLDTEDLHCLRFAREQALKANEDFESQSLYNEKAKREIASILRCDLTLMISKYEINILKDVFHVDSSLLVYVPFLYSTEQQGFNSFKSYSERSDFISIGNFLHPPNWDAVRYLKETIWPAIRAKLPSAKLSVFGAYTSQKVEQLHNPKQGFLIKGRADSALEVIHNSRVMLAPLRFGAGLKGKLFDAMLCSTPSVTSSIGAEGMIEEGQQWSGFIEDEIDQFVDKAVELYADEPLWNNKSALSNSILKANFDKDVHYQTLSSSMDKLKQNLKRHRDRNFLGQILHHHTAGAYKYMSKWIEEKNKK